MQEAADPTSSRVVNKTEGRGFAYSLDRIAPTTTSVFLQTTMNSTKFNFKKERNKVRNYWKILENEKYAGLTR